MDAASQKTFLCSDSILSRWFLRSRNGWKAKALKLRKTVKRLGRRVSDVSGSRDGWKQRASAAEAGWVASQRELARLKAERESLQQALAEAQKKKPSRPTTLC